MHLGTDSATGAQGDLSGLARHRIFPPTDVATRASSDLGPDWGGPGAGTTRTKRDRERALAGPPPRDRTLPAGLKSLSQKSPPSSPALFGNISG